jgi:hypothetical protein
MRETARQSARDPRFCHLCGKPLSGRYYHFSTGLVCCAACHATRPRCARCKAPLDDAALAQGRAHQQHEPALCTRCRQTAPRCAACSHPIAGAWYTFDELLPPAATRRFCVRCVRSRPRCDLCRAPVGPDTGPLDDGQYRCAHCASGMVLGAVAVQAVYDEALTAFARIVGESRGMRPQLEVVSRLEMGGVRRKYERLAPVEPPTTGGHHVLGFFVLAHGASVIYVERGLPRGLLLGTLAHELGHAWQAAHAPSLREPLLCEGFAEWVAHHILIASGLRSMAARATRRDDIYGRGLRHFLAVERERGRDGALALARGQH